MKKVINGRRYDTDSAKALASTEYSNVTDFHHWEEILYRKNTGEFFLHGSGGPASKYAESIGMNQWTGGSKIIPMTLDAAQQWAEAYLDADEYDRIFGKVEESTERRTVTFSLPESTIEKIARLASEKGITKSEVIVRLLDGEI